MTREIAAILNKTGPLPGAQLLEHARMEVFALWRACTTNPEIRFQIAGTRFLRLDRAVEDYARLSPSIRREFLTYTLLGLEAQSTQLREQAELLRNSITQVSQAKIELARYSMAAVVDRLPDRDLIRKKVCFIIAGDITYNMGHTVPRPERSTGEMVRGSDLDIVVIAEDDLPQQVFRSLDNAILRKKHELLNHPNYREEVDYIVKNVAKVQEQLRFDGFESMVACKILNEGRFLHGSAEIFGRIKTLLAETGVPQKLSEMQSRAENARAAAASYLLELPASAKNEACFHLFYTREESEEIY